MLLRNSLYRDDSIIMIVMYLHEIYSFLAQNYIIMNPHHNTWQLWLKKNKNALEIYEVALGTILVQNTNWHNVDLAMSHLFQAQITSFETLLSTPTGLLMNLIKPAGFINRKATYLRELSQVMQNYIQTTVIPTRKELLACRGIGPETADSLLVYCFNQPSLIIGAYTRRLLCRMHGTSDYLRMNYNTLQKVFSDELPREAFSYGHFHALIVCHCQNVCQKLNPSCDTCILINYCSYGQSLLIQHPLTDIQLNITKNVKKNQYTQK